MLIPIPICKIASKLISVDNLPENCGFEIIEKGIVLVSKYLNDNNK